MTNLQKIVLHIGIEKTGTTTLQTFLALNRNRLRTRSVLYPCSLGDPNHLKLSVFADYAHIAEDVVPALGIPDIESLETFRSTFRKALRSEVESASVDTLVLSNEHCHSYFQTTSEISRLKDLLSEFSSNVRIVVYFRRQDRVARSHHSTKLKFGHVSRRIFPQIENSIPYYYDYYLIFKNWSDVFGKENIRVRRFDPRYFFGGSLLHDFIDAAGLTWSDEFSLPPQVNQSLEPKAQVFLTAFNKHVPRVVGNALNPRREGLITIFERHFSGGGTIPSRREATEFYSHFIDCNRSLELELGSAITGPLFDDDFSDYPDEENPDPAEYEDAVTIASVLWTEKSKESAGLRAENCYLSACLAEVQNKTDEAIGHLERALELDPEYLKAVLLLASQLSKSSQHSKALALLRSALDKYPGCHDLEEQIRNIEEKQ